MIAMPTSGFAISVEEDNVELDALCDWIEGSLLFSNSDRLSGTEVADILCENNIYRKKEMANVRVSNAWSELKRRHTSMGTTSPFIFESLSASRKGDPWKVSAAHAFCVLLSLSKWYRKWAEAFGSNYTKQGELFEQLTKESLEVLFVGWQVRQTGWTTKNTKKLRDVVSNVSKWLGESEGNVKKWSKGKENEAGLDIVCFYPFMDGRGGLPAFFFQCSSGTNYDKKFSEPRMHQWHNLIEFTAKGLPMKAFSTPYAFLDHDFTCNCQLIDGLLLDRYRLLAAGAIKSDWLSKDLISNLSKWGKPRAAKLPKID